MHKPYIICQVDDMLGLGLGLHLYSVFSHGAETMDTISGRVVILRTVVT